MSGHRRYAAPSRRLIPVQYGFVPGKLNLCEVAVVFSPSPLGFEELPLRPLTSVGAGHYSSTHSQRCGRK